MATLLVPTSALAEQMECDIEGRLEVMADDGLRGKPDYVDADTVAQLLREHTYPSCFWVSDGEAAQAYITLENMLDFEDVQGSDWQVALDHLRGQGYR